MKVWLATLRFSRRSVQRRMMTKRSQATLLVRMSTCCTDHVNTYKRSEHNASQTTFRYGLADLIIFLIIFPYLDQSDTDRILIPGVKRVLYHVTSFVVVEEDVLSKTQKQVKSKEKHVLS